IFITYCSKTEKFDILIIGGKVIDGAGNPWEYADVGVIGDKIVKVGMLSGSGATKKISAEGLYVTPGFIDMHTHSDYTLLVDGTGQSKLRQGVTLEVIGESESAGPVVGKTLEAVKRKEFSFLNNLDNWGLELTWGTLGEYFKVLENKGISSNVASYVGLGQIRSSVVGKENRKPTDQEMKEMKQLIREAMEDGAMGLSCGLLYVPDMFFSGEEIAVLAKAAGEYHGILAIHIRSEDVELLQSIDEAIKIGKDADIPVEIFHFKASAKNNWYKMPEAIIKINAARESGLDITANQYPYIAGSTTLTIHMPRWAREGSAEKIVERLKDPAIRQKIKEEMKTLDTGFDSMEEYMSNTRIADLSSEKNKELIGKSIIEIAREKNKDPYETYFDLLVEENASILVVLFIMTEENKKLVLKQPWVSICSDGAAVRPEGILGKGKPHPRYYGTFPRVLAKYVREENVITLEEAIRKMTSLAAHRLGIQDRGLIKEGMYADICVFDYEKITDHATYENPHQYSEGVVYLLVNGELVMEDGEHTGAKPGRIIYGPGEK
ncbi:amidohydrolase family protein, partial [candidate division KSB1 bacterium]